MGIVVATTRVFSPDGSESEEIRLIVNTGSTLTWVPAEIAEHLGLRPLAVRRFRTVDGSSVERPIADALIECVGERGTVGVVFGQSGDARVLGVTALERLGLEVDPGSGTLRKVDAYLALVA